ncbi:OmpH family outer membrane protein [Simiduia sp. 21SJ11W-1]|uniref:OmpH family outer membrane protein n=1 Tax=Simiduia sp. 21SJ11W-1 TaxID=2909669 RepID=UPI00209EA4B3|nr:OmpH family outer membrane protein [Simiduia sp. 21SJ11W-1]UTA46742.1 OmpH family outer membrane protein [Simiduia sp. 21SJ11W-1]
MSKLNSILLLTVALIAAPMAMAADKVVVFDLQSAILNTDMAKKRMQDMQSNSEFASMQAKFESLRAELQKMAKEAEKNGVTWNQEQSAEHRKKMEYARADLELVVKKLQAERNATAQRVMEELNPKAQVALKDVISAEGIGIVLSTQTAYYAEPSLDITAKVTEKLNKAK